jgi:hypothetical protein
MTRFWGHIIAAATVVAGSGVIMAACAHNDQSVFIRGAMFPPTVQVGTTCAYPPDPTLAELDFGTLDGSLTSTYSAALLIGNQLVQQGEPQQARAESNRVELQGVTVDVTDTDGSVLRSFTRSGAGFVEVSSGNTPGYGVMIVEVVDEQSVMTTLGKISGAGTRRIVAHIKAFGKTLGGQDVETNQFDFPIDVCNGCLVTFPAGSDDPMGAVQPNCSAPLASGGGTAVIQPCFIGQDQPVDCRLCQDKQVCVPSGRATTPGG